MAEDRMLNDEILLGLIKANSGGGGGTTDYEDLNNLPKINSVELKGNKSLSDLGIASAQSVSNITNGQNINNFAGVESALSNKQDTLTFDNVPTANSNNPVKSGGVKSAIDAAVSSAYHHAGTKTCAELVAGLLVAANEGNVYNMTDSGTTTADFIEGAGQPIKAGDNVGIAKISDGVYKFDLLSGFVDTTNFVQKSVTAGLLKNDGTVDTTIQGDVDSLKSGLTTLDNEVNGDATVYPYADVITIEDAVPSNLAECNVKIEPVQDLHGYDHPWVGGAGKNKLPFVLADLKANNTDGTWSGDTYTLNGVSFTILKDADGNVTGVKTGNNQTATGGNASFNIVTLSQGVTLDSGSQYIGNGCPANGSTSTYYVRFTGGFDASSDIGEGTGVKTVTTSAISVYIRVTEGATVSDLVFTPMIRLSTETDATFAPYTNICHISGHTEASVQRDGKNLFNKTDVTQGYLLPYSGEINPVSENWRTSGYIKVAQNTEYVESGFDNIGESYHTACFYDKNKNFISGSSLNSSTFTFTTPSNTAYVKIDGKTADVTTIQLELGSSSTDYEPFKGKTYTITLGDTIYGGTVDFDSGVMTVDRAVVDLGDFTWGTPSAETGYVISTSSISGAVNPLYNYYKADMECSQYQVLPYYRDGVAGHDANSTDGAFAIWATDGNKLFIRDLHLAGKTAEETKTYLTGVQVLYKLTTPFTVQLTPQQIQLLQGTNTLYASTGQISVSVNGVSGAIGSVQEQVNATDEAVAKLAEQLPTAPTTDGAYVLTVTVADGTPTYSWESAT